MNEQQPVNKNNKSIIALVIIVIVTILGFSVYYYFSRATEDTNENINTNTNSVANQNQNVNASLPAGTKTCDYDTDCKVKYDCEEVDCYHIDSAPEYKCDPTLMDIPDLSNYSCVCAERECTLVEETDTTTDWQTYTNPVFGYSINYPAGWSYEECDDSYVGFADTADNLPLCFTEDASRIEVKIYEDSPTSFEQWVNDLKLGLNILSEVEITVDIQEATKVIGTTPEAESVFDPPGTKYIKVITVLDNDIYELKYREEPGEENYSAIYEGMYATFQFTE